MSQTEAMENADTFAEYVMEVVKKLEEENLPPRPKTSEELILIADTVVKEYQLDSDQAAELSEIFLLRAKEMFEEQFINEHPELKREPHLNCTCEEFFAEPENPFDQPIEELMEECNA